MVRAPCCEKMGLKRGPWTQEEDQILVSYIQRYGHGNWRALPKQAELLRCGKSCRLRWTNYLRPDIKRGNFSKEEEDMIISLHEMLGNRWSAIAAKLPGRTDNEIKNVWHTHLKKRLKPNNAFEEPKQKARSRPRPEIAPKPIALQPNPLELEFNLENCSIIPVSSVSAQSDISYSGTDNSLSSTKYEYLDSEIIDESFWNEALSMDIEDSLTVDDLQFSLNNSPNDEDITFWLRTFREAGDLLELPEL